MWPYFFVLIVLVILAVCEATDKGDTRYGIIAAVLVGAFSALRYETGYDWLAYDAYFRRSPDFFSSLKAISDFLLGRDVGFALLTVAVKTITLNVQFLFIAISIFTVSILHYVLSRFTSRMALIWLAYFGLLFISAQMTLLRQNIASVIIILGLLASVKGHMWKGISLSAIAATFHISVVPFIALPALSRIRPSPIFAVVILALGLGVLINGVNILPSAMLLIEPITPTGISVRLIHYAENAGSPTLSLSGIAMTAAHIGLLILLYWLPKGDEKKDTVLCVSLWLLIGQISAQLYLAGATDIWARTMLVVTPWSLMALFRLSFIHDLKKPLSILAVIAVSIGATGTLWHYLSAKGATPLVPYHSLLHVAAGDQGNGRQRAIDAWSANHPNTEEVERTLKIYKWYGVYPWRPPSR